MMEAQRMRALVCLLVAMGIAGCGDESTKPHDDLPTGCGSVLVVTTDYSTGALSEVSGDSSGSVRRDLAPVHSDAIARVYQGRIYVVNRFGGDNVQVVDTASAYATLRQIPLGPGSNPHDIAFVSSDRAYVSRFGSDGLVEIDPGTGAIRDTISVASFADPDGIPDMDRMFYRSPYLYVAVERIDFGGGTYQPVPPSWLAVVDTRTNTLVDVDAATDGIQGIELAGLNPSAPMIWDAGLSRLLVPEAGVYGLLDAGVEKVDLDQRASDGWLVREEALGGDLIDFVLGPNGRGYATVARADLKTSLVVFDAVNGAAIGEPIHTSPGYDLADLEVTACGVLLVCDRNYANPGLRLYDAGTGRPIAGVTQPVSTGLPPFELVRLE
jgi:hypothetical protein